MQVFAVFAVENRNRVQEGLEGRVLERLDTQSKRIDDLKALLEETDKKVSQLVREFGFIKKAWWIGLIALGFVVAKLTDYLPAILSLPSG